MSDLSATASVISRDGTVASKPPPGPAAAIAAAIGRWCGLLILAAGLTWLWMAPTSIDWPVAPPPIPLPFETVVVDAGHGGKDRGASANGLFEKDLALDTAERLAVLLRKAGLNVVMTREKDEFITLGSRTRIANRQRRAIFVSIHFNHAARPEAAGLETFFHDKRIPKPPPAPIPGLDLLAALDLGDPGVPPGAAPSQEADNPSFLQPSEDEQLADWVQQEMVRSLEAKDRGVRQRGFYVVRHTTAPSILVEGGFVSNANEASLLNQADYRQKLAEAIFQGIMKYRGDLEKRPFLLQTDE